MKKLNWFREINYLLFRTRRDIQIDYVNALNRRDLLFLLEHPQEREIFKGFEVYGPDYLDYIQVAIEKKAEMIIDLNSIQETHQDSILRWVFLWKREERN